MSKILVTGGTGFIGNHIVRRLCAEQLPVRVLARATSPRGCLESLPVEVVLGDLLDRESLRKAATGCDTVFHVAADYRLWARHPEELYRNNVEGTEQLLAIAFEAGVRRFIHTSTVGTIGFQSAAGAFVIVMKSRPTMTPITFSISKSFSAKREPLAFSLSG